MNVSVQGQEQTEKRNTLDTDAQREMGLSGKKHANILISPTSLPCQASVIWLPLQSTK